MDAETVDRLLIDRALGELPPDTAALLAAFLEKSPEYQKLAADTELTMHAARLALASSPSAKLPPLKCLPVPQQPVPKVFELRPALNGAWKLAACFLAGCVIGPLLVSPSRRAGDSRPVPIQTAAASISSEEPGFWSASLVHHSPVPSRMGASRQLIWQSPVQKPLILPAS